MTIGEESLDESQRKQRGLRLAKLRMTEFGNYHKCLAQKGHNKSRKAVLVKFTIIVLGAFVAIRGVIEQFMKDYNFGPGIQMPVAITFIAVGVLISIFAGLDAIFKYERNGAGLMELSQRSHSFSRDYMASLDNPDLTSERIWEIIREQNNQLQTLNKDALQFGVDLSLYSGVDFTNLSSNE